MSAAPTILVGALIFYTLHILLGVGFFPTLLAGVTFAALSGYVAKRRNPH